MILIEKYSRQELFDSQLCVCLVLIVEIFFCHNHLCQSKSRILAFCADWRCFRVLEFFFQEFHWYRIDKSQMIGKDVSPEPWTREMSYSVVSSPAVDVFPSPFQSFAVLLSVSSCKFSLHGECVPLNSSAPYVRTIPPGKARFTELANSGTTGIYLLGIGRKTSNTGLNATSQILIWG